jgi:biopolymer transport protein ExbD
MNLKPGTRPDPEINLTSLIDVVFLLLIFFMVSTTFERQAALRIDLPEASAAPAPQEEVKRVELIIDPDGRMYLNDRQLADNEPATIEAALLELTGETRDVPVLLRADAMTPHYYVVRAMDVTGRLGFTRLSIATEHVPGPEE